MDAYYFHKISIINQHIIPYDDNFIHTESMHCLCCPYVDEYSLNAIIHNNICGSSYPSNAGRRKAKINPASNGTLNLTRDRLFGNSTGDITIQDILNSNITW